MTRTLLICLLATVAVSILFYGCNNATTSMSPDEILYRGKCSSCHMLIAPDKLGREKWTMYVNRYGKKMTTGEKQRLLDYLAPPQQQGSDTPPLTDSSAGPIAGEENR